MNCPNCNAENPEPARYCSNCGIELPQVVELAGATEGMPFGELRPMSIGDLLTRTFDVYQKTFLVFLQIALIAQLPLVAADLTSGVLSLLFVFVGIITNVIGGGAVIYTACHIYVGRRPTVSEAYRAALRRAASLVIANLLFWSVLIACGFLAFLIIGIPLFFYVLAALFFFDKVIMVERLGPVDALVRSRGLVHGTWWRVFGIGVVFVIVQVILFLIAAIVAGVISNASDELGILANALATAFVVPFAFIGGTLVYFDLRVRKERYNVSTLAADIG